MLASRARVLGVLIVLGSSVGVVTTQRMLEHAYDREVEVLDDERAAAQHTRAVDEEASARLVRELVELVDRIGRARTTDYGCHYMPERERLATIAQLRKLKQEQAATKARLEEMRRAIERMRRARRCITIDYATESPLNERTHCF